MPDLFFSNEREGHFHNIIVPNVYVRIFPDGKVLYSIRYRRSDKRSADEISRKRVSFGRGQLSGRSLAAMISAQFRRQPARNGSRSARDRATDYRAGPISRLTTQLSSLVPHRISLTLSCPMNLKLYPLDKQMCSLLMISCKSSRVPH